MWASASRLNESGSATPFVGGAADVKRAEKETDMSAKSTRSGTMQQDVPRAIAVLTALLLVGALLLLWPGMSFAAAPTLGPDCGAAASVAGSDSAGKVTMGTGVRSTCTLTFSATWTDAPACTAMSESGRPAPVGTKSTTTTLVLDGRANGVASLSDGDVVSYICVGY